MEKTKEIRQIICKWESSLENYGKIDSWQLDKDLAAIDGYVSSCEPSPCTNALRRAMYFATTTTPDTNMLRSAVQSSIKKLSNKLSEAKFGTSSNRSPFADTYQYATKRMFNERLRFKDNKYLRNIDPEMEDGETARKVRRIVEKRMCQEYYKAHRGFTGKEDRRDRIGEVRATSYQMHNLGRIEKIDGMTRTDSTHWKRVFDDITGQMIMKPKKSFDTLEEAEEEARKRNCKLETGSAPYSAYKCAYCGKYHIGHRSSRKNSKKFNPASAERNLYDRRSFAF